MGSIRRRLWAAHSAVPVHGSVTSCGELPTHLLTRAPGDVPNGTTTGAVRVGQDAPGPHEGVPGGCRLEGCMCVIGDAADPPCTQRS
jgi:hypothetical protein